MKKIALDRTYIDYWHRRGSSPATAGQLPAIPEDLSAFGDVRQLLVPFDACGNKVRRQIAQRTVEEEILWHMRSSPKPELLAILTGKKAFQDALTSSFGGRAGRLPMRRNSISAFVPSIPGCAAGGLTRGRLIN
jgi:hypothetical protein